MIIYVPLKVINDISQTTKIVFKTITIVFLVVLSTDEKNCKRICHLKINCYDYFLKHQYVLISLRLLSV
jgi:hypothetical protein